MKLRTKLIIAFVVVMIFPVTFALIAMHAFVPKRGRDTAAVSDRSCPYDSISNLVDLQIGIGPAGETSESCTQYQRG